VPIGDAVTYLFGTIGAALMLAKIGPRLIKADLKVECEQVERELGGAGAGQQQKVFETYAAVDLKAFRIAPDKWAGRPVSALKLPGRAYVQRMRRGKRLFQPDKDAVFEPGDVLVVSGTRADMIEAHREIGEEVVDPEAMEMPFETVPVVITTKSAAGHTLAELAQRDPQGAAGVHLRRVTRQGQSLPRLPNTRVERGDVVELVGRKEDLDRVIPLLGVADRPTEKSDLIFMSLTCIAGILLGAIAITLAGVPISLGTSGGVLIAGLIFGWLHAARPQFGRIPAPAVWLMETLGLNVFVAVIGLSAGPHAVAAMKSNGLPLVMAGVVVTLIPHLVTILFGRHVLKLNAGLLMGACAGAGTVVAALQAVQDDAESSVPALGFTVPYALSNVLLTAWGPVVVALVK
jgi:putative transport protein